MIEDTPEEIARSELRKRQGAGARYDAPAAPGEALLLARRGSAYFSRLLNGIADDELYQSSAIAGWTRAHVVAHVGYHARGLAMTVEGVRNGDPVPFPAPDAMAALVELGASLPARALRNLFYHAEIHLNVEWRDLTDAEWNEAAVGEGGQPLIMRDMPLLRARELWSCALKLAKGGNYRDIPAGIVPADTEPLEWSRLDTKSKPAASHR